jgi:ribosomal protein L11 methyltransferase
MPWLRITLDGFPHDPDRISELLNAAGAEAVTFEDAADQAILEPLPGETHLWGRTKVSGLFAADADSARIIDHLRDALGDRALQATVTVVDDQDWERAWMDQFQPMRFGRRLWICPHWHTPPKPQDVTVMLDPGLAFGTGTHATTALCLEWLDAQDLHGKTVIDYGCGSGILAIAAAKLGARHIWAVDHDPQALTATGNNAAANGVESRISLHEPGALPQVTADVLLANILAGPLLELAPRFARLLRPGGNLVLSGILREQTSALLEKYQAWFNMEPATIREEWVRLSGRRNDAAC